ncbi:MAG: F0F1 ATP synthase subunit delta [Brockia lithotrophica]|nr:F0F1 ATP synthase subunit delta [Brockia lithotrophica]
MRSLERRRIARRYARALVDAAFAAGVFSEVLSALEALVDAIRLDSRLRRALAARSLAQSAKEAALAEALSGAPEVLRRFVRLLVREGRIGLLPEVLDAVRAERDRREGVVRGVLELARPEDREFVPQLEAQFASRFGGDLRLEVRHVPEIIAGFRLRAGGILFDGAPRGSSNAYEGTSCSVSKPSIREGVTDGRCVRSSRKRSAPSCGSVWRSLPLRWRPKKSVR